ncbi:MAG TPA: TetR/AcrR family transcriptional regulator [Vitreimonas sp.]|jgi:AcrR family transcriptional regulator|nr:TetR/AcrR family transcriptional regulator [Vitreimonas sp.]
MIKAATTVFSNNSSALPPVAARGADAERRSLIMDKGEEVFLEQGFQGASMAEIAARANCSKGTLYNYFESKDELFLACVARHCEGLQLEMLSLARSGGDVRQTLSDIGRSYVRFVSSDAIVRRFRMIAAEGERAPEITRAFYAMGPGRGVETLSAYIRSAMEAGELRQGDATRAARNFFSLCNGHRVKARLCNAEAEPAVAEIDADVAEAVRVFMAGYGT